MDWHASKDCTAAGVPVGVVDRASAPVASVAGAFENGYEGWTIKLADGSTWQQTDGTPVALPPRRGDKVVVKRGAMGSYFVRLGSQPGFKAKRIG